MKILYVSALVVCICQIFKFISFSIQKGKIKPASLFYDGGMPSAHSAFTSSVATMTFLETGASELFAISLVLAFVVINDAIKVRRAVGKNATTINIIVDELKLDPKLKRNERSGHTPLEVVVGVIVGVGLTFFLNPFIPDNFWFF